MKKIATVLLVEDDVWLAELEVKALKSAGYEVHHVTGAAIAMDKIDELHPDVMILDVLLTGSTAFALLHELQTYDDTAQLPVILCTGMAESVQLDDVTSYGVRRIVDKTTMTPEDLVAGVRSVVK